MSRYADVVRRFREAVLSGAARLSPEVRAAAFRGGDAEPAEARAFLDKVRRHAHRVDDADVAALRAAGWDDATIYELTVACALGQGLRRLDAGLAALAAAKERG